MKKFVIPVLILVFGCIQHNAQAQSGSVDDSKLRFGLQVSPVVSWLSSDESEVKGGGVNVGLKLGALGEYNFAKNYSIAVGIGFGFSHGGKLQFPGGGNLLPKSELPDVPAQYRRNLPADETIHNS